MRSVLSVLGSQEQLCAYTASLSQCWNLRLTLAMKGIVKEAAV